MPNVYIEQAAYEALVKQEGGIDEAKERVNELVKTDLQE